MRPMDHDLRRAIRATLEDPPQDLSDPLFLERCDRAYYDTRDLDWEFSERARDRFIQKAEKRMARD